MDQSSITVRHRKVTASRRLLEADDREWGEEMPLRTKVRSGMGSDGVAAKVWVKKHLSPNL